MKAHVLPVWLLSIQHVSFFFVSVMTSQDEEVKGLNAFACIPSNCIGIYIWNVNEPIKIL